MQFFVVYPKPVGLLPKVAAFFVRIFTRRPGQRLADVPTHVAILAFAPAYKGAHVTGTMTLYEAISTGVRSRSCTPLEMVQWSNQDRLDPVDLPWPKAALSFGDACALAHDLYDWRSVEKAALHERYETRTLPGHAWICSQFAYIFLRKGGVILPATSGPCTPNDLQYGVRSLHSTRSLRARGALQ
jgi:hypothetical protein